MGECHPKGGQGILGQPATSFKWWAKIHNIKRKALNGFQVISCHPLAFKTGMLIGFTDNTLGGSVIPAGYTHNPRKKCPLH